MYYHNRLPITRDPLLRAGLQFTSSLEPLAGLAPRSLLAGLRTEPRSNSPQNVSNPGVHISTVPLDFI